MSKVNIILIALIVVIVGGLAGGYFYMKDAFAPHRPTRARWARRPRGPSRSGGDFRSPRAARPARCRARPWRGPSA